MCLCLVDLYKLRRPLACLLGLPRTLPLVTSVLSVWIVKISNFPVWNLWKPGAGHILCIHGLFRGCLDHELRLVSSLQRGRIGCRCASLVSSEAEAGPNVGAWRAPLLHETGVFPFWARNRVRGSWYGSGPGCVMNACSVEDSGVLKASSLCFSSFRTFLLGLWRLGPVRVSSPSSS